MAIGVSCSSLLHRHGRGSASSCSCLYIFGIAEMISLEMVSTAQATPQKLSSASKLGFAGEAGLSIGPHCFSFSLDITSTFAQESVAYTPPYPPSKPNRDYLSVYPLDLANNLQC